MTGIGRSAEWVYSLPVASAIADKVTDCVNSLRSGFSVHLTGLPGSGRSHVLQLAADELNMTGIGTIWVRGNRLLAQRPFSSLTLAGLLPTGHTATVQGDPLLKQASDALEAQVKPTNTVLIVDDGEDLDWASAGVISAVRRKRRFAMMLAGRASLHYDEAFGELLAIAQPGVEVRLDELPLDQVNRLANALLGGVVEPGTASQIATLSGGLPDLVETIVMIGRRTGRLEQRDGMWCATGELWDHQLGLTLRQFLVKLDPTEIDSLTRLARCRFMSLLPEAEPVDSSTVRRFARMGLVRFERGGSPYVFPQALAELLCRTSGPVEALSLSEPGAETALEPGRWLSILAGADAAALANRISDYWQVKIADCLAEWNKLRVPATALPLLAAMRSGAADADKVNMVLTETERNTDDLPAFITFIMLLATYRATWGQDLPSARAELRRLAQDFPEAATYARIHEAHLALICERVPTGELLNLPADSDDIAAQELLQATRLEAMLARGEVASATAMLADFHPQSERAATVVQVFTGLARLLGGDADSGVAWALAHLKEALEHLQPGTVSGHAYVAALGMAMLGRFDELNSVVEVAFRLANVNALQNHYQTGLLLLASRVADWEGRRDYALSLATQATSLSVGNGPFPGMHTAPAALAESAVAPAYLWDLVDDLLEREYVASAVYLAVAAVESEPNAARAAKVVEIGTTSESWGLRAQASYIACVVAGDVDLLTRVIDELRTVCGPLNAMRAGITRALLLRDAGDFSGWLEQAEAAWHEGDDLGRRCGGLFARLVSRVDLTSREAEVVGFAAQNLSATQIAAKTGVTKRTVEAHLLSAYKKIGVRSRQELRPVVSTWLTL